MRVVQGVDALDSSLGRLFVVVGVFDGLHRGHLYLLEHLRRAATARQAEPTVITFDHHPDEVILGTAPALLCDPEERLERLAAAGVGVTVVQTFDVALRMTEYDQFVRRIADRVDLAGFLMTPESAFGHDRGGTPETVAALGAELGYETVVVPPYLLDGEPVSSGAIRRAIAAGDLATAERLLGRPVSLHGDLEPEPGRPRAELRLSMPMAMPPAGAYAVTTDSLGLATLEIGADGRLWIEGDVPPKRGLRVRFQPNA
jgi:riboflavin kinase/FMN adenylyltransferase